MFDIKIYDNISPLGLSQFDSEKYRLGRDLSAPNAILLRSHSLSPIAIESSVLAIARAGAGVNSIPVDICTERGITVFNTPGANANSVKELVIAALLLSSRRIHEGINWLTSQINVSQLTEAIEKKKYLFTGSEIAGKKLGVIGLGSIGVLVANAAEQLGMKVSGYDPFISVSAAWGLSSGVRRSESLNQLMANSDYISLHVPLTQDTENLINENSLKKAKPGLRILNFARDGLVNADEVKAALKTGTLSCYVTDFPVPELLGEKGVIPIPHLGASTTEAEENCAVMAVNQLKNFLENGNIRNSVNFPNCSLESTGSIRLIVVNKNVPNILSQILSVLAQEGLNVEDMVNRHQDQIAYNIIELSPPRLYPDSMKQLNAIDGVIITRQICRDILA
ncbi:D-3-phosphoglycerate dehydrogenase [Olavius algarvensis spirochete endosymbiont]|uniref:3-phosphoglycerate dehydrogenase family protein n=1 Tax=Olavius algarvensis spirochete endosymbiont TaxID=260710 RepID=UPI00052CE73F|nr:3-phosphoglycerate dehydrogenase family protein [Olavius algarvensis spirochete endosymbiont]KGM38606.1 3-phosphoglycerate dehydrogenase [Alkalispirochaeta odontotermitis]VDB00048.1 D-3-phosphoglycerate dehydrogenase [Olavius algarvensis spirochete endosymbiont]